MITPNTLPDQTNTCQLSIFLKKTSFIRDQNDFGILTEKHVLKRLHTDNAKRTNVACQSLFTNIVYDYIVERIAAKFGWKYIKSEYDIFI